MRFGVLGPLEVLDDAGEPIRITSAKQRVLMAILLCHRAAIPPDRLLDLLWLGNPPESARANLHVYVHRLRQLLGDDKIVLTEHGYQLDLRNDEVDADAFESLADEGRAALASGDYPGASRTLGAALALWRGEPCAGNEYVDLVGVEATRLEDLRLAVIEDRNEAELHCDRHATVVTDLKRLVAEYPLRERFAAQLMVALYRSGRTADALAVYRDSYRHLVDELGIEPGSELRELEKAILDDDPALLAGSATDQQMPPAMPTPAQLPRAVADFTGRTQYVAGLSSRMVSNGQILTITGMAGVGKTALALRVAHASAPSFPDGQLYIDLRGMNSGADDSLEPEHVLYRFLIALGVPGSAIPDTVEERAACYRSHLSGRRMIVVLDNAASEEQIRPLIPGAAECSVLVTSRDRLSGLAGAHTIDLDVFEPAEAVDLLARIVNDDRVADEPAAARELCMLCGYVPLAVRIAGARLASRPHWSLRQFVELLGDERRRLDELKAGDLAVRSSLALSYRALSPDARRALRLLGSCRLPSFAGWVVAAALDVSLDEGNDHLAALIDAHLVNSTGYDATGRARYKLHDLVALFAQEQSEVEDLPEAGVSAMNRVGGAWLALAEVVAERIPGACYATMHGAAERWHLPSDFSAALLADPMAWFDAERDAMVAIVGLACDCGNDDLAWDLAGCLEKYLDVRGQYGDFRRVFGTAREVCKSAGNVRGEAVMLRGLAELSTWHEPEKSPPAMLSLHERAREVYELFRAVGDDRGMADALVMRTWGYVSLGDLEKAVDAARQSLDLAVAANYLGGRARAYHVMGIAAFFAGRPNEAIENLISANQVADELGNPRFRITAMQFLGGAMVEAGRNDGGRDLLNQSLGAARRLGDGYAEAFSLLYLTRAYLPSDLAKARKLASAALAISERFSYNHHRADALTLLGQIEIASGRAELAVEYLEPAVELWRSRGWQAFLDGAQQLLEQAYAASGRDASGALPVQRRPFHATHSG